MKRFCKLLVLMLLIVIGCSPKVTVVDRVAYKNYTEVDFCELPLYRNKKILLTFAYSGIEEYWSLNPVKKSKCADDLKVDLDFAKDYVASPKFEKLMEQVHESYWNSFLRIKALGTFESQNNQGYGHLGTNNSRFLISEIIEAELVKKRR